MRRDYEFKLHSRSVRELLMSEHVRVGVQDICDRIAAAAGPGMLATSIIGKNRVHGSVITDTVEAKLNERRHRSLTRAISSGFGDFSV